MLNSRTYMNIDISQPLMLRVARKTQALSFNTVKSEKTQIEECGHFIVMSHCNGGMSHLVL